MSTNSSGIVFSGLGSGVDTNSIVTALMQVERRPITTLNTQKAKLETQRGVEASFQSLFNTLRDKAKALTDSTAFTANAVTVKDATLLSASATSAAGEGTYAVTITQLAKAHTLEAAATPTLANDTLSITVDGDSINVAVNAGESMSALASRINATADTPVTASVINNHLVLISKTEGASGSIGVTSTGSTAADLGFVQRQAAQDAIATINGISITSSGNTIDDAIEGMSITLAKEGSTTIAVKRDADTIVKSVQGFIDAYNAAIGNVRTSLAYDPATKTAGALQGDQSYQTIVSQLRSYSGTGVSGLTGSYTSLSSIGITADRNGVLSLNQSTFKEALSKDPAAVAEVFTKDTGATTKGYSDGIAVRMQDLAGSISTDIIGKRLSTYATQTNRITQRIADLEEVMTLRETRLRQKFSAMDTQVARFSSIGSQIAAKLG